jgi:hypothetical protein
MAKAALGEGTFASIDPGDMKTPLPMTMLMTMANASMTPIFLNYAIPQYLKMIRRVVEKQREWGVGSPLGIACQKGIRQVE